MMLQLVFEWRCILIKPEKGAQIKEHHAQKHVGMKQYIHVYKKLSIKIKKAFNESCKTENKG